MKVALGLSWVWLYLMVVVVLSASRIRAQKSIFTTLTSASVAPTDLQSDGGPTVGTEAPAEVPAFSITDESRTAITAVSITQAGVVTTSTGSESPADTHTPPGSSTTQSPGQSFSSQPPSPSLSRTPSVLSSKEPLLVSLTTAPAPTTTGGSQGFPGPTHQETPPQLNVGGEDFQGSMYRSLDPLLAGLLSVFIVTTAVIFVVLFLKFRHQNSNPEFHRLQDLPMDDLMEDTPLSRYTY